MKKLFLLLALAFVAMSFADFDDVIGSTPHCPSNEIWYTSADGIVKPHSGDQDNFAVFGANIVSNKYDADKDCWVITFDGDITTIGNAAFVYCSSLTSVTIPDSVTEIGGGAFYGCSRLTSVTIPDSVTTIGDAAFNDCSRLTSVTIPDSVTTIGVGAFCGCSSLKEFNGKYASEDGRCLIIDGTLTFFASAGLTEYTIPDSVTSIGSSAFSGCSSLTSVTIGDSVTTIGDSAFNDCSSLTSITIPDSVTTIGDSAFFYCSSLTSVIIGDSVTTIEFCAFSGCSSLTSVTIPDSVTTIVSSAFSGCSSLTSVYCKATTPPAGGDCMFYNNASDLKIYVPMESVKAYKWAEGWSKFSSYIVGYNF